MKSIAILAVAGLAAAASAQTQSVTLHFDANVTEVEIGDTISWTVSASFTGFDDPTAYYGGFVGTFDASDASLGTSGNFMNQLSGTGTAATSNGASVDTLNIFNAALLGTDDPSNPIDIFTFDVVAGSEGVLSYEGNGVHSVFPDDGIFTLAVEVPGMSTSDSVAIIPAPGAVALLGLGGLAAARRRR